MITITGVQTKPREMRQIQRGWGMMHWLMLGPILVPFIGLWFTAIWGVGPYPDGGVLLGTLIGTPVAWVVARHLVNLSILRAARRAPTGNLAIDWRLNGAGIDLSTELVSSRLDWSAFLDVREESDRFVFLLTPSSNPVLPKRALTADQLAALRALITEVRASGRLGRGVD